MNSRCWVEAQRADPEALSMALCFVIAKLEQSHERIKPEVLLEFIEEKLCDYGRLRAEAMRSKEVFP